VPKKPKSEMLSTPWDRARKRRSQAQEERVGSLPGGSPQINSGRIWRFKRDAKFHTFLVECRTNEKPSVKSYRLDKDEFLAIERDAFMTPPGYLPAMQIDIQELQLFVMRLTAAQNLLQVVIEQEAEIEQLRREIGQADQ
jgi:hypothetical protein